MELAVEERRDLARQADHREQVDAIHGRSHVEHDVPDRKDVEERRPRLDAVGQRHDPRVVVAEADLVLGEDHPARGLAPELALVERLVEDRQEGTGERDGDGRTRLEVPRAADDLPRVALPHVHLAHAQPVGVRVRADLEDAPDEEAAEIPVDVGHPDVEHALDLEGRDGEPLARSRRQLRRRSTYSRSQESGALIENCPRSRGSLRQSSRRSGIPWRSTAIRSSPQPNAKPV